MWSDQCFFVRLRSFVSFRMLMRCFAKYETIETDFRIKMPISRNKEHFSRNTKLVSHEIRDNFVRKKLEGQP